MKRAFGGAALTLVWLAGWCAAAELRALPPESLSHANAALEKGAGEAVNGLKLVLSAAGTDLPATPPKSGEALVVEPTTLQLTFANVSDKPVKLDAYCLTLRRVRLIVVGPGPNSPLKKAHRRAPGHADCSRRLYASQLYT